MRTLVEIIVIFACIGSFFNTYTNFNNSLPMPVEIKKENLIKNNIEKDLIVLNAPQKQIPELTEAILTSYQLTGINPKLIIALMKTESEFNKDAIGPKNRTGIRYKGTMQTPTATFFTDVDTLHGVRILKEKLKQSNNDLQKALALYKGGDNPVANKQAKHVIDVYKKLQQEEKK